MGGEGLSARQVLNLIHELRWRRGMRLILAATQPLGYFRGLSTSVSAHIVLVAPEIPWNTGNAGRSCLAFGARLHLVEPVGFKLDEKAVRRAGLDYWKQVDLTVSPSWEALSQNHLPAQAPWVVTPEAPTRAWEIELGPSPILVFGSEQAGLPASFRQRFQSRQISVPMPGTGEPVRALNVSTTVGILLYEVARQRAEANARSE